jgi:hypothetical protein
VERRCIRGIYRSAQLQLRVGLFTHAQKRRPLHSVQS